MLVRFAWLMHIYLCVSGNVKNLHNFGEQNMRNTGAIIEVHDKYGFLLCAKKCKESARCSSFNFSPEFLLCELIETNDLTSVEMPGWWFFKNTSVLEGSGISNDVSGKSCEQNTTLVKLKSGSFKCLDIELPIDCQDVLRLFPSSLSWTYRIYDTHTSGVDVFCDMETDGGGWTVFQSRQDGSVDFYRTWAEYKAGFGNISGEFWLGNDNLHRLVSAHSYTLRVDLEDFTGARRYAKYSLFSIANESEQYKISIGGYSGDAGDSGSYMNGRYFSTKDADFDLNPGSCSVTYHGAWWYGSCHHCNLNGLYHQQPTANYAIGVVWREWKGHYYSLKTVSMKVRRN